MKCFGLTGGIASGKSTISLAFKKCGIPVIDADSLAREAVRPNSEALKKIIDVFGTDYLQKDGNLNRKKLGALVFSDKKKLQLLESIVHPEVQILMLEKIKKLKQKQHDFVIYEAPLLFETGIFRQFDKNILLGLTFEIQLQRLMKRDQLSKNEAIIRIKSQMSLEEKINLADVVIDNSQDLETTATNIQKAWYKLTKEIRIFDIKGEL